MAKNALNSIVLLLFLVTKFPCNGQAYDTLDFKIQFKPDTKYLQTLDLKRETYIKYSGSDELIQKLKDKGIENPKFVKDSTKMEVVYKTYKLTDNTSFPFTLEYIKTFNSNNIIEIPDGSFFYGHCLNENTPILDSFTSKETNEEINRKNIQTIQENFRQFFGPEAKIRVGESFSRESRRTVPFAGDMINFITITNYKLLSIDKGIGYFNISQVHIIDSNSTKSAVKLKGRSTGEIYYDILNDYYLTYRLDTEMEINRNINSYEVLFNVKSNFNQKTIVIKN